MDFCPSVVFKESIKQVNCTWPFVQDKSYICTHQELAWKARKIQRNVAKCENPCNYIKVMAIPARMQNKSFQVIRLIFPENIQVYKAYFAYNELSLIAEIGGYVGLFLGWSVFQITDLMNISKESLKKNFDALKRLLNVYNDF